jgi:hypothetical protein
MGFFDRNKISDSVFNAKKMMQNKTKDLMKKVKDSAPLGPAEDNSDPNKYNNVIYVDKELQKHNKDMQRQQDVIDKLDKQLQEMIEQR